MSRAAQSRRLKDHIASLETMTRFVLAHAGAGQRQFTPISASALCSTARPRSSSSPPSSIRCPSRSPIYGFWTYLIRFLPEMRDGGSRLAHARHHGGRFGDDRRHGVLAERRRPLPAPRRSSSISPSRSRTTPPISTRRTATRSVRCRCCPTSSAPANASPDLPPTSRTSGALTGTSGSGSVVQLLSQMSAQMKELETAIAVLARDRSSTAFEQGQKHLATMRGLVSAPGPIEQRSDQFAAESVALSGRHRLAGADVHRRPPSAAPPADLSVGFIAPVADGMIPPTSPAGRTRSWRRSAPRSSAQSKALSDAAGRDPRTSPRSPSAATCRSPSAEAVLRYAADFIPSWAGAISIDLLPAVLVGVMCGGACASMRRGEDEIEEADRITAGDMMRSLDLARTRCSPGARRADEAGRRRGDTAACRRPPQAQPPADRATAENVTPLTLGDRKRRSTRERDPVHPRRACPGTAPRKRNLVVRYLSPLRRRRGGVAGSFRGMLLGAIGVLALDLATSRARTAGGRPRRALPASPSDPILPPVVQTGAPDPPDDPRTASSPPARRSLGAADDLHASRAAACSPAEGSIEPEPPRVSPPRSRRGANM